MVMLVIAIGCFYAVPNLFGEDHAVQVVATRGAEVTASTQASVNELLASKSIAVKRSELEKVSCWSVCKMRINSYWRKKSLLTV